MNVSERLALLRPMLQHRHDLLSRSGSVSVPADAIGGTVAGLRQALAHGRLVRIIRGWYVEADHWRALTREDRHLVRVLAVHSNAVTAPLFSHLTAAAIHGLPLLGFDDARVHLLVPAASSPQSRGSQGTVVVRHGGTVSDDEIGATAGLRRTDLTRTVIDVARTTPFEFGLVCADAALRLLTRAGGGDHELVRARALERLESMPRSAGKDRATRVLGFASALAESPLESLTRLQLARLGFEVREQVRVERSYGREYRMDFELVGHDVFLEADGKSKYLDERQRGGRSAEQTLILEKEREDWVRGRTRKGVVRSGWQEAQSTAAMAARLRAFRIASPNPRGTARPDLF